MSQTDVAFYTDPMRQKFKIFLGRLTVCLLLIGFCALVGKGWHLWKDGFSYSRIQCELPSFSEVSLGDPPWEALKQTYTYLGRGHQCYAFASEDGRFVIKFPRYDRYRASFFLRSSPFAFLQKKRLLVEDDVERRRTFLLESFRLAFAELQKETALLYTHFHRTHDFNTCLHIKDRVGRSYTVDLNRIAFIVQEKKGIMMKAFQDHLQNGERLEAKRVLDAFVRIVCIRAAKGIYNKDPSFLRNFGWQDGEGVQIDIGSFYRKADVPLEIAREKSLEETLEHVRKWLAEVDLEMLQHLETKVGQMKQSWSSSCL